MYLLTESVRLTVSAVSKSSLENTLKCVSIIELYRQAVFFKMIAVLRYFVLTDTNTSL